MKIKILWSVIVLLAVFATYEGLVISRLQKVVLQAQQVVENTLQVAKDSEQFARTCLEDLREAKRRSTRRATISHLRIALQNLLNGRFCLVPQFLCSLQVQRQA